MAIKAKMKQNKIAIAKKRGITPMKTWVRVSIPMPVKTCKQEKTIKPAIGFFKKVVQQEKKMTAHRRRIMVQLSIIQSPSPWVKETEFMSTGIEYPLKKMRKRHLTAK